MEDLAAAFRDCEKALGLIARKNEIVGNDDPMTEVDFASHEFLQWIVFAVGKAHGFENLRDWFKALYEVLLGAVAGAALWWLCRALRRRGYGGADRPGAGGRAGLSPGAE